MDYSVFPAEMQLEIDKKIAELEHHRPAKISEARARISNKYENERKKTYSKFLEDVPDRGFGDYIRTIAFYEYKKVGLWCIPIGAVLGAVVYFVILILSSFGVVEPLPNDFNFITFVIYCTLMLPACMFSMRWSGAIFGLFPGCLFYPIFYFIHKAYSEYKRNLKEQLDAKINREIYEAERRVNGDVDHKINELREQIKAYREGFENEAEKLSVSFANSEIAKEIIEWLTNGFVEKIRAINRASYIENAEADFVFYVEKNVIGSAIGNYSFIEHSCDPLPNALYQTALARAIASQVNLNLRTIYEKDESGSNYSVDVFYEFPKVETAYGRQPYVSGNSCTVIIRYLAANLNYLPRHKW